MNGEIENGRFSARSSGGFVRLEYQLHHALERRHIAADTGPDSTRCAIGVELKVNISTGILRRGEALERALAQRD